MREEVRERLYDEEVEAIENGEIVYYEHSSPLEPPSPEEVVEFLHERKKGLIVATPDSIYKIWPNEEVKDEKIFGGILAKKIKEQGKPASKKGWLDDIEESDALGLDIEPLKKPKERSTKEEPSVRKGGSSRKGEKGRVSSKIEVGEVVGLSEIIDYLRSSLKERGKEESLLLRKKGQKLEVLEHKKGDLGNVEGSMEGDISIHSHPGNRPPSLVDLRKIYFGNVNEGYVVAKDSTYKIRQQRKIKKNYRIGGHISNFFEEVIRESQGVSRRDFEAAASELVDPEGGFQEIFKKFKNSLSHSDMGIENKIRTWELMLSLTKEFFDIEKKDSKKGSGWINLTNQRKDKEPPVRKKEHRVKAVIYDGKKGQNPDYDDEDNIIFGGKFRNKKIDPREKHRIVMNERMYRRLANQWTGASEENAGVLLGYMDRNKSKIKGLKGLNLPEMKEEDKGLEHLLASALGGTGGTLAHEKVFNYFREKKDRIGTYHSHPTKDKAHWNDKEEWKKLAERGSARVHMVLLGDSIIPGRSGYGGTVPYYVNENGKVEKALIEIVGKN